MFLEIADGKVTGERLNGTLLSGGGDWITLGSDGWGKIDVRGQMVTDDGAYIYAHYTGLLELNEKVINATAAVPRPTGMTNTSVPRHDSKPETSATAG